MAALPSGGGSYAWHGGEKKVFLGEVVFQRKLECLQGMVEIDRSAKAHLVEMDVAMQNSI